MVHQRRIEMLPQPKPARPSELGLAGASVPRRSPSRVKADTHGRVDQPRKIRPRSRTDSHGQSAGRHDVLMESRREASVVRNPGVVGIGLASVLSDAGHEMATAALPGFLRSVGAPAAALGAIEGVADGALSFSKLGGGVLADQPGVERRAVAAGVGSTPGAVQARPVELDLHRPEGQGAQKEEVERGAGRGGGQSQPPVCR